MGRACNPYTFTAGYKPAPRVDGDMPQLETKKEYAEAAKICQENFPVVKPRQRIAFCARAPLSRLQRTFRMLCGEPAFLGARQMRWLPNIVEEGNRAALLQKRRGLRKYRERSPDVLIFAP